MRLLYVLEMRSNERSAEYPSSVIFVATGQQLLKRTRRVYGPRILIRMGKKQEASSVVVVKVAFVDEIWGGDV